MQSTSLAYGIDSPASTGVHFAFSRPLPMLPQIFGRSWFDILITDHIDLKTITINVTKMRVAVTEILNSLQKDFFLLTHFSLQRLLFFLIPRSPRQHRQQHKEALLSPRLANFHLVKYPVCPPKQRVAAIEDSLALYYSPFPIWDSCYLVWGLWTSD